jgi:hypothetical protein
MVVTVALVCYSIAIITILDISSTALMILGSDNIPLTVHGFLGYSALTVMLVDTVLIWRHWLKNGTAKLSRNLNLYTRIAYGWWVIAYIAGAIISMVV